MADSHPSPGDSTRQVPAGFLSGGGSESPQDYVGLTHNNLQIDNVPQHNRGVIKHGWKILHKSSINVISRALEWEKYDDFFEIIMIL